MRWQGTTSWLLVCLLLSLDTKATTSGLTPRSYWVFGARHWEAEEIPVRVDGWPPVAATDGSAQPFPTTLALSQSQLRSVVERAGAHWTLGQNRFRFSYTFSAEKRITTCGQLDQSVEPDGRAPRVVVVFDASFARILLGCGVTKERALKTPLVRGRTREGGDRATRYLGSATIAIDARNISTPETMVNVIAHELGHAIGLDHSFSGHDLGRPLMWPFTGGSQTDDDLLSARDLYHAETDVIHQIEGRVVDQNGRAVPSVAVIAVDRATGARHYSTVTRSSLPASSDPDRSVAPQGDFVGRFSLPVRPGIYSLHVESIPPAVGLGNDSLVTVRPTIQRLVENGTVEVSIAPPAPAPVVLRVIRMDPTRR